MVGPGEGAMHGGLRGAVRLRRETLLEELDGPVVVGQLDAHIGGRVARGTGERDVAGGFVGLPSRQVGVERAPRTTDLEFHGGQTIPRTPGRTRGALGLMQAGGSSQMGGACPRTAALGRALRQGLVARGMSGHITGSVVCDPRSLEYLHRAASLLGIGRYESKGLLEQGLPGGTQGRPGGYARHEPGEGRPTVGHLIQLEGDAQAAGA